MAKMTFQGQSESVRDVQFNPFYANYFAACFDNGNIQVKKRKEKKKQVTRKKGEEAAKEEEEEEGKRSLLGLF